MSSRAENISELIFFYVFLIAEDCFDNPCSITASVFFFISKLAN